MYIYGDLEVKPVHTWNAVDVRTKDGVFQHGHVINTIEGGLLIDLDSSFHRSEFFEYGHIFDCSFDSKYSVPWLSEEVRMVKNDCIEVLIRPRPDQPWTWLPGKLIDRSLPSGIPCVLVDVEISGVISRELVMWTQIQFAPSDKDLMKKTIGPGKRNFVQGSCLLPTDYWTLMTNELSTVFKARIQKEYKVILLCFLSEKVTYVHLESEDPISAKALKFLWDSIISHQRYFPTKKKETSDDIEVSLKHAKCSQILESSRNIIVSYDILVEIFVNLDSITRVRCRRTCKLWNEILLCEKVFSEVRISASEKSVFPFPTSYWDSHYNPHYICINCLLKCVNSYTKCIIISDLRRWNMTNMLELIHHFLKDSHIKRIIFCDSIIDVSFNFNFQLGLEKVVGFCAPFDLLIWKDSLVIGQELNIGITHASFKLNSENTFVEIWNVLDKNINGTSIDSKQIAEWISSSQPQYYDGDIPYIIMWYQSCDPRFLQYRDHKWTEFEMGRLDVNKLTKITLFALHTYKNNLSSDDVDD